MMSSENKADEVKSEIGKLVDMSLGNFIVTVKKHNVGVLQSLINTLSSIYFNLKSITDTAVKRAVSLPKDSTEYEDCISLITDITVKMQSIEDKVFYLRRVVKRRLGVKDSI